MPTTTPLDGNVLYSWAQRVVAELGERRSEINALNVFPVPDADTGSNMMHTMESALAEAARLDTVSRGELENVVLALATGSVRGARGNSGVILSQVLRGISQAVGNGPVTGSTLAEALEIAVKLVDTAINDPVEGTVVTVLRAAMIASREAARDTDDLLEVTRATVDAARIALANTPSQLAVLREAGVVDAGGTGFIILLEALLAELDPDQEAAAFTSRPDSSDPPEELPLRESGHAETDSHGVPGELEVMFLFTGEEEDVDKLSETLEPLGESLTVARGDGAAMFHIHTPVAGDVVAAAYASGEVRDLRLEILPQSTVGHTDKPARLLLALTPPGPIAELYRTAGAAVVEVNGASEPDPVSEVLSLIRKHQAGEVVLFPNGLLNRRQLLAVDNATRAFEQSITLLPTARLVSGIAALAMHDPAQPLATATYAMNEAANAMRTATCHRAEQAALTGAGPCARGDILVVAAGEIVAVADTVLEAVERAGARLLEAGGEQVTVLSVAPLDGDDLARRLGVDVMVFDGTGLAATGCVAEIGVE